MIKIKKEIDYIIKRANECDARIVRINELLLFSTETGDAWILDTEDKFAICLMQNWIKQKYKIIDTSTQFGFDWDYQYHIEGDSFIVLNKSGVIKQIFGYPIQEIEKQINK
ncbi:MAG: hypothetical protein HY738_10135 [Bacteroidia bacterium]|nr:hypothetical protein [Bacteroidia bacterium]